VELRLIYARLGFVPKKVKAARNAAETQAAWKNESVRYFYLAVRKGYNIDPSGLSRAFHLPDGEM
jgi:hypothetical protein